MRFRPLDFLGPVVRTIPQSLISVPKKVLYLTFDDGPHQSTDKILKVLSDQKAKATFFVVSNYIQENPTALKEIVKEGHSIGNHSTDHGYKNFFKGRKSMLKWINDSEEGLKRGLTSETVGFRPPAGVCTPELHWALKKLNIPLVLWQTRFYDSVFTWSQKVALRSIKHAKSGDIILLHDRQPHEKLPLFLKTLEIYIEKAKELDFVMLPLTRKICLEALTLEKENS